MSGPDTAPLADDTDGVIQPVMRFHAADASPLHSAAASSVFNWRQPGSPAPAPAPEPDADPQADASSPQPQEEKPTMAKKRAARSRASSNGSPQLQICSALLQFGAMTREALGAWSEEHAGLTAAQISSALNNAKSQGRVVLGDEGYELTTTGADWHRRGRAKREEVDTFPEEEEAIEPTFRCAVMSDGCFFITKDGNTIELEPEEHKQMLHYLERMAETDRA